MSLEHSHVAEMNAGEQRTASLQRGRVQVEVLRQKVRLALQVLELFAAEFLIRLQTQSQTVPGVDRANLELQSEVRVESFPC